MNKEQLTDALAALRRGRERMARPGGWTQYAFGRTALGIQVSANAPDAVSFCARGALHCDRTPTATPEENAAAWNGCALLQSALEALAARLNGLGVVGDVDHSVLDAHLGVMLWNDKPGRTVEHVLFLYDQAIALGEERLASAAA